MKEIQKMDKINKRYEKNTQKIKKCKNAGEMTKMFLVMSFFNQVIAFLLFVSLEVGVEPFLLFIFMSIYICISGFLITSPFFRILNENNPVILIIFLIPLFISILNVNMDFMSWNYFVAIGVIIASLLTVYNFKVMKKENAELKKLEDINIKLIDGEEKLIATILTDNLKIKELNNYVTDNKFHMEKREEILNLFLNKEKDLLTVDSLLEKEGNLIINM